MQGTSKRVARWAALGCIVFMYMHVADELWSRWDFGAEQVASGQEAAIKSVLPLVIGLWAFAWIEQSHRWASVVAGIFGLATFIMGGLWHLIDTAGMTPFRYAVVLLTGVSGVVLVAVSLRDLFTHPPWAKGDPDVAGG